MFERARWITATPWISWSYPEKVEDFTPSPYIAKNFDVNGSVKKAELNIVGFGQAAYFLNGCRVADSYRPTLPQNPMVAVVYNTYDVTDMLVNGKNRLGVVLGNNGFNDLNVTRLRSALSMIAELNIIYRNGDTDTIVSDKSWKKHFSPTLFSMRRCGEKYDARLAIKEWCNIDYDDSSWEHVTIWHGPGGIFRPSVCPPTRIRTKIKGQEIAPGVFDFGMSVSGWVHLSVSGESGSEIVIKYAERLSEDQNHVDQSGIVSAYEPMAHKDRYILCGEKKEEWEQLFSYHGFRYVEIEGEYNEIAVEAVVAHTDLKTISHFECDNKVINQLHSAACNSILTNCHGALVDCPHREQNEWTGDGMLSAEAVSVNFDAYHMFYHWMQVFQDEQFPDGRLPCIIPAKNWLWEYNFASGPDWDSAIFHIPYYSYKYTGNPGMVDLMWDNMCRSLSYFTTRSDHYLINIGVGDWACLGNMCNKEITDTAYYRIAAVMMAEMAHATGRNEEPFLRLADAIKKSFRAKYIRNGKLDEENETAIAMTIFSGMLEESEAEREAARLAEIIVSNGYRLFCGVHGLRTIFDVLSTYGHTQVLFDTVTNDSYPGYAQSLQKNMNSLPETINMERIHAMDSLNHHFRSPIDTWFYKYLAGITIRSFGFSEIVIQPRFVNGINSLKANFRDIFIEYDEAEVRVRCPYDFAFIMRGVCQKCKAGEYRFRR